MSNLQAQKIFSSSMSKRSTMQRFFLAFWLAISCTVISNEKLWAQSIRSGDIAPFEVEFNVGNNLINAGSARLSLTQVDDLWTYTLSTKPRGILKLAGKGKILETSTIKFDALDDGLQMQPQSYVYRQDDERRRAVDANFDWQQKSIKHTYRGNTVDEAFKGPLYDRLSVTLLIMNALRHEFEQTELQVFDTGRIKTVAFSNDGTEVLKTPLGNIETIRILNRNAAGGSRETTTWFAPSLDYVPVKIEHRKRGELVARLTLTKLENRVKSIQLD